MLTTPLIDQIRSGQFSEWLRLREAGTRRGSRAHQIDDRAQPVATAQAIVAIAERVRTGAIQPDEPGELAKKILAAGARRRNEK